jgi:hypothetical protein
MGRRLSALTALLLLVVVGLAAAGCRTIKETAGLSVVPKSLRDVPADRLAFRFEPDVAEQSLPEYLRGDETEEPLATIKATFETQRTNDALIRTVLDPTRQRALVLYGTKDTSESNTDFRIDLYSTEGQFIRNVLPADLTGVFPAEVAWSPDGQRMLFSGVRTPSAQASPTPIDAAPLTPDLSQPPAGVDQPAAPEPSAAPIIASVQTFRTEQVYTGDRDGFNLRPLTSREGLIYFKLAWSPDGQQVAALACREDEWESQRKKGALPAGRPRLITLEGQERLLDDRTTPVAPVWSPDGSKVATAFDYDIAVYDGAGTSPTGGGLSLREPLRAASVEYDARVFKKAEPHSGASQSNQKQTNAQTPGIQQPTATPSSTQGSTQSAGEAVLISLNPFVRLEWVEPETLLAETAFVRFYSNDPVPTFKYTRWHVLRVSPQAVVFGLYIPPRDEAEEELAALNRH